MDAIRERLNKLKQQRKVASSQNFKEVLEENEIAKRPANWEKRRERDSWKIQDEEERQKAAESGKDYELIKTLDKQADELERWDKIKASKKRPDPGFEDYESATRRQYGRLVKQLKPTDGEPDVAQVTASSSNTSEATKPKVGDNPEAIERMVQDVHQQIESRSKRSRRRRFNDGEDVDYVNERNMRFNKKLEKFYGKYTDEIKQNFERGTAK